MGENENKSMKNLNYSPVEKSMNLKLKRTLEFFAIVLVTVVVALSSPLNPWASNAFTDVQNDILSIYI